MNQPAVSTHLAATPTNLLHFPKSPRRDDAGDDRHLVERIAAGDEAAMSALYRRYAGLVISQLTGLLGHSGETEEVMQEVFLQVWQQAGRYRQDLASPKRWILVLARSRALDRLKSGAACRRREEVVAQAEGQMLDALGSERLEREERCQALRGALARLPNEQRQALELAFFKGLTQVEIANRLGAPLGTVKSRTLLGLRKLRQALTPDRAA